MRAGPLRVLMRVQPLPSRFHRSAYCATSPSCARFPATTASSAGSRIRRSRRLKDRNRAGACRLISPSDMAHASRSTSVTVSAATGSPRATRTLLMTALFSRTGIVSGCGPAAQYAASSPRLAPVRLAERDPAPGQVQVQRL